MHILFFTSDFDEIERYAQLVCVHVVPNSVHSRVNFAQTTDPNMMVIQT